MTIILLSLGCLLLVGGLWVTTTNLIGYVASSAITVSLNALATSSTWLVGRQSTAVDNSTNKYLDYLLAGFVKVGTPTAGTEVRVYVVGMEDDTTWPDTFGASDAGVTVTSAGVGSGFLKLAAVVLVDATTTGRVYYFGPVSVASLFGGVCPRKFAVFVTHNTGANLDASAGGTLNVTPVDTTNG